MVDLMYTKVASALVPEGREATEVDQVDLFDDLGLTASSLVSIDCNEDRGNGPASLDKSFEEDKYVAKEKVVGGMMDNLSIDATDGSNVGENVLVNKNFLTRNWLAKMCWRKMPS